MSTAPGNAGQMPPILPQPSQPRYNAPSTRGFPRRLQKIRAFSRFLLGLTYFLLAGMLAHRGALGLVPEDWVPLVEQAMLVFLLLLGYAAFGFLLDRQPQPLAQQGLPVRSGWLQEVGTGAAIGWAMAIACLLPLALVGRVALRFTFNSYSILWLVVEAAYFALATLALQIAFRGYPFQRAIAAIGELPAALTLSVVYGIWQAWISGSTHASVAVSIVLGLLLAMAYLRTRALWLPWGLHFGWMASRALLFGLPVENVGLHSPVIQGEAVGPAWFTGADFGTDSSWFAFFIILVAMPFLYRATRELSYRYNAPVLIPGGIPVDMDAAARRQHDAATRPDLPEVKPLVQILPVSAPAPRPVLPNLAPEHLRVTDSDLAD